MEDGGWEVGNIVTTLRKRDSKSGRELFKSNLNLVQIVLTPARYAGSLSILLTTSCSAFPGTVAFHDPMSHHYLSVSSPFGAFSRWLINDQISTVANT